MKKTFRYAIAAMFALAFVFLSAGIAADTVPTPENLVKEIKKSTRPPVPPPVPGESSFSRRAFRAHRRQLRQFNTTRANWGEKTLDDAALRELTGNLGQPLFSVVQSGSSFMGGRYIRLYSTYLIMSQGADSDTPGARMVPLVYIESAYTGSDPARFAPLDLMEPFGNEFSAALNGENHTVRALDGTPPFFFDEDFKDYYAYGSHLRYWTRADWPYDSGDDIYVYGPFPDGWPLAGWPIGAGIDRHRIRYKEPEPVPNITVVVKDGEFHYYTTLQIDVEHISAYDDDGCGDGVGSYFTWSGISLTIPVNGLTLGGRSDRDSYLYIIMPTSTIDFKVRGIYIDDKIVYTGSRSLGSIEGSLTLNAKVTLTTHR